MKDTEAGGKMNLDSKVVVNKTKAFRAGKLLKHCSLTSREKRSSCTFHLCWINFYLPLSFHFLSSGPIFLTSGHCLWLALYMKITLARALSQLGELFLFISALFVTLPDSLPLSSFHRTTIQICWEYLLPSEVSSQFLDYIHKLFLASPLGFCFLAVLYTLLYW